MTKMGLCPIHGMTEFWNLNVNMQHHGKCIECSRVLQTDKEYGVNYNEIWDKENCVICNARTILTNIWTPEGAFHRYTCKCGKFDPDKYYMRQKYAKLVKKYGDKPELLTEILMDLKI